LWELYPFELRNFPKFTTEAAGQRNSSETTEQNLFHIVMVKFPIPENCSAYVPMILKEFCSSKINGLLMKNLFREIGQNFMKLVGSKDTICSCEYYQEILIS
jgi:hypothetical protein